METISVFLDDYRQAPEGYVLVETIDQCKSLLQDFNIEHLSLDHDLVSKQRNGLMLVQMMVKESLYANRITIHSANAPAGKAMYFSLLQAQKDTHMPQSVNLSLRPLPLKNYSRISLQYYDDNK
ncbi:cyclic-phosphate processing receiver domain-containing protein [Alteribacter aurantiacus]|uniref:cyclic-phosphate processing receiver domain-containing protein n=1 Tax=Alteribacter aurantiacus TaxID=254410 RepID=UPI0004019E81|nr:cyclic-phosphate processing receiver domain-containing protein [Alteribacter aurantiacus]